MSDDSPLLHHVLDLYISAPQTPCHFSTMSVSVPKDSAPELAYNTLILTQKPLGPIGAGGFVYGVGSTCRRMPGVTCHKRRGDSTNTTGETPNFHLYSPTLSCFLETWREDTSHQNNVVLLHCSFFFFFWLSLSNYEVKMEKYFESNFTKTV